MVNSYKKIAIGLGLLLALIAIFFYFIPAFQGKVQVSPVIDLGVVVVRWYGLIMAGAILSGYFVARKHSYRFGLDPKEVDNLTFWLVIVGIIGARLYYVAFAYDYFLERPAEIFKLWRGGMSIYGALIAGLLFVWLYVKRTAYGRFQLLDLLALSLPLAQALGRFGNFFNQEAYGAATQLPWKLYIEMEKGYHHPVFLYEALASVIIFFVLKRLTGKLKSGSLAFAYLGLYSLTRFFIEMLRVDSVFVAGFRADQIVAFIFIIISVSGLLRLNAVEKRR